MFNEEKNSMEIQEVLVSLFSFLIYAGSSGKKKDRRKSAQQHGTKLSRFIRAAAVRMHNAGAPRQMRTVPSKQAISQRLFLLMEVARVVTYCRCRIYAVTLSVALRRISAMQHRAARSQFSLYTLLCPWSGSPRLCVCSCMMI